MNEGLSSIFPLKHGVPKGSCLGPLLFIIYTSKLFDVVEWHLPDVHCYADDTRLYLAFSPDESETAVEAMRRCIDDLRQWMFHKHLKLNDDKTEFLLKGTKQQLAKINIGSITVGNEVIQADTCVRNLGSWFDSTLSMSTYITKAPSTLIRFQTKTELFCSGYGYRPQYNAENDHRKRSHSKTLSRVERFENDTF